MTIKALFPTVRPTLNLDFAKTKVLDPRITFTRASTGTYVGADGLIKTAAVNEARFDHNPATGGSLGLLVEEARTNLITYSQAFNSTNYSTGYDGGAFTENATASPDGTVTASKLTRNTGTAGCWWSKYNTQSISVTSGTVYTISCYLKAGEISTVNILGDLRDAGGLPHRAAFTLTGNGSYVLSAGTSAQITPVGNGWYRCSVVGTADATTTEEPGLIVPGTGTSGQGFFAWGFQLEAGAFPTSYIPTTTATVTRAGDVASMTGTNFSSWYNQSEGTIFSSSVSRRITAAAVSLGGSGPTEEISNYGLSNSTYFGVYTSGAYQASINTGSITAGQAYKQAGAYAANNFGASRNGATAVLDANGLVPVNITYMNLGVDRAGDFVSWALNGTIARITYYPVRLPDTQLQALTAT